MKAKDISKQNGLDNSAFEAWLRKSSHRFKSGVMGGLDVDESQDISGIVSAFKLDHAEQQRLAHEAATAATAAAVAEAAEATRLADEKKQALARMLITSGFSFDGYTITKYSGYISGDDAIEIPRGSGGFFGGGVTNVASSLMTSLVKIRRQALAELKEAAYDLGCNAVIGVDFDYLTLDPQTAGVNGGTLYLPYVFGVTANGNAVVIEKHERQ